MQRSAALALSIIFFFIFVAIAYYGAGVTLWSSIIFSVFVTLILLNIFYPPSQLTSDTADYSLVIYALIEIFSIILLAIYIIQHTLSDVRTVYCHQLNNTNDEFCNYTTNKQLGCVPTTAACL